MDNLWLLVTSESKELNQFYDYLTLWDGEEPLLDILRKELRNEKIEFTNVIDLSQKNHRIDRQSKTPRNGLIPSPDFSDYHFKDYFLPEPLIPMQTTRGCYAACAFCAIPFGSNKYQMRSVEKIVTDIVEIQRLTEKQTGRGATYFKFMEDTSSPKILYELSLKIEKMGLNVKWETFARLEKKFSEPGFMKQLYRGGCRKIHWGLESNDPDILTSMNKKTSMSYTDEILRSSGEAGILNFCFVLVGFPGETDAQREALTKYIINNEHIHTLTLATFDLTRKSHMEINFKPDNIYKLDRMPAKDFQVRLPYTVNGENWKKKIIPIAHKMMIEIIKNRPDIGFMTLFPDQIRSLFCDHYGNAWGRVFVEKYGSKNIQEMLLTAEQYASDYSNNRDIDPSKLPEPLQREHFRTKEDLAMIANAVQLRREYEQKRFNQV